MSSNRRDESDSNTPEDVEDPKLNEAEGQDDVEESAEGDGDGSARPWRLRKKKEMPGGLWLKCESCNATIYRKELEEKGRVCPACGFHFTLPGRERIRMVLDDGSWEEHFEELTSLDRLEFNDKVPYRAKIDRAVERSGQNDALICGLGRIQGKRVSIAVLDFTFMGGSMGEVVGEKIALAAELAVRERVPLILFTSSGGARMHEGVLSLMQMAKTCSALATLNDHGGYSICVMTHPTTGGVTASFATVCDITLAEPGALIGFAGPRVIATTLKQELPPGFQRSEFLLDRGQLDSIVRRSELRDVIARLIDYGRGSQVEEPSDPAERAQQRDRERRSREASIEGEGAAADEAPGEATPEARTKGEAPKPGRKKATTRKGSAKRSAAPRGGSASSGAASSGSEDRKRRKR